ncbi:MAG TPA: hypothetical protein VGS07_17440 [Thermoanaerobaculia bacterium]|jgi:hypothetical protein|nr:hypothetical protein [Thermoanaerobaculia bacterium]
MAWTNYRNIVDRFIHIDADFVSATSRLTPEGGEAEVVVRFYPCWEHPLYKAALSRGERWGFSSACGAGVREVRVKAVRPWVVHLSPRPNVIDWRFEIEHPLLWNFDEATLYVNGPYEPRALLDGLSALKLRNVSRADLLPHVDLLSRPSTPRALKIPTQLLDPALSVFRDLNVPVFAPRTQRRPSPEVVFLIDEEDYIIADDFEVDVPEFQHEPEWFQPEPVAPHA